MSLRVRIASLLAAVAFGVGTFAAFASYLSTRAELHAGIDETLRTRAAAVRALRDVGPGPRGGRARPGPALTADGCPSPALVAPASAAQITTARGATTPCLQGGVVIPFVDTTGLPNLHTYRIDGERYRVITMPWRNNAVLQIARSLSESEAVLGGLRLRLAGLVAVATAVAAGLGYAVASHMTRPIVRLRDTTHQIATTLDLSPDVDTSGPGEVGSLATSFATMVAALARSRDQQRRLVADASHEMRTPLTSLRSNVELLRRVEKLPAKDRKEVVDDVLEDVDELATLLGELVDLASDLAAAEELEPVQLGDLARAVATRTQRRTNRGVSVVSDDGGAQIMGRPRQLERAIGNLVDNAVKYSDAPVAIEVNGATVTVCDRGRGIPAADVERVFDRFYRAVDVRTEPGSGLGLAIVDEIVRSHGGTTFARNRDGGGAEVGFTLSR